MFSLSVCCRYGQYVVGELHFKGEGGADKSHTDALACYRAAADQGHDGALFELGYLHRSLAAQQKGLSADSSPQNSMGFGCSQDDAAALNFYLQSACRGNPAACFNVGVYHEHGMSVAADRCDAACRIRAKGLTPSSRDAAARWCGAVFRHFVFVTFYTCTRALQQGVGRRQRRL